MYKCKTTNLETEEAPQYILKIGLYGVKHTKTKHIITVPYNIHVGVIRNLLGMLLAKKNIMTPENGMIHHSFIHRYHFYLGHLQQFVD